MRCLAGKISRTALLNSTIAKVSPLGELTIAVFSSLIPFNTYLYTNLYLIIDNFLLFQADQINFTETYMEH